MAAEASGLQLESPDIHPLKSTDLGFVKVGRCSMAAATIATGAAALFTRRTSLPECSPALTSFPSSAGIAVPLALPQLHDVYVAATARPGEPLQQRVVHVSAIIAMVPLASKPPSPLTERD